MVERGCNPNLVTFGVVFNGLCKEGDVELALDLLKKMEEQWKIEPDVVIYNTVIDGLCRFKDVNEALKLFNREMVTKEIRANVVTYNTLITCLCKNRRWSDASGLLSDMTERSINPHRITFSALFDASVKAGKLMEAEKWHGKMIKRAVAADTITYNSFIYGLCMHDRRLDEAKQMFDFMVSSKTCLPDKVTYSILIHGFCKAKRIADGMDLFRKMHQRGLYGDTVTYTILIQAYFQTDSDQPMLRHQKSCCCDSIHSPVKTE